MNSITSPLGHRFNTILSLLWLTTFCAAVAGSSGRPETGKGRELPVARTIQHPGVGFPFEPSLSHNGDYLSFSAVDIYVYDTTNSARVATLEGGRNGFLPGDRFFVSSIFNVKVFEKGEWTNNPSRTIWLKPEGSNPAVGPYAERLSFSGDGRWFVVARPEPLRGRSHFGPVDVEFYEVDTGEMQVVAHYEAVQVIGLALSQDGSRVAIGLAGRHPRIEIMDVRTRSVEQVIKLGGVRNLWGLWAATNFWGGILRFSLDGSWLGSTIYDMRFRLWELRHGSSRAVTESECARYFAFSPSSEYLVFGCPDPRNLATLSLWSLVDRSLVQTFNVDLPLQQGGLGFSGDGKYLAVATREAYSGRKAVYKIVHFDEMLAGSSTAAGESPRNLGTTAP